MGWAEEVKRYAVHADDDIRYIDTPARMRQVVDKQLAILDLDERTWANMAGVRTDTARRLHEVGYAPVSAVNRLLKALQVRAAALPSECFTGDDR